MSSQERCRSRTMRATGIELRISRKARMQRSDFDCDAVLVPATRLAHRVGNLRRIASRADAARRGSQLPGSSHVAVPLHLRLFSLRNCHGNISSLRLERLAVLGLLAHPVPAARSTLPHHENHRHRGWRNELASDLYSGSRSRRTSSTDQRGSNSSRGHEQSPSFRSLPHVAHSPAQLIVHRGASGSSKRTVSRTIGPRSI